MRIVLLGCPGVGKGTQAKLIALRRGVRQIATGDILRQEVGQGTELGLLAQEYMDRGDLVPDEIIINMMQTHLQAADEAGGFLLDGFPRTVEQARALDQYLVSTGKSLDHVIALSAPGEVVVHRLSGRLTCNNCGATYHETNRRPRNFGTCDVCGGRLQIRSDDDPEAVRTRLQVYEERSAPLLDYYRSQGLLRDVDASGEVEEVYALIEKVLDS
ncbi:MAG: adenylate kinase [Armatimonadota bacterium]